MSGPNWRDTIARVLHEAHKPYCDYTYAFEHPMSSREIYEALSAAVLDAIKADGYRLHRDHDYGEDPDPMRRSLARPGLALLCRRCRGRNTDLGSGSGVCVGKNHEMSSRPFWQGDK